MAYQLVEDNQRSGESSRISQDVWFQDWPQGCDLTELAKHDPEFDETFALLWLERDSGPEQPVNTCAHAAKGRWRAQGARRSAAPFGEEEAQVRQRANSWRHAFQSRTIAQE